MISSLIACACCSGDKTPKSNEEYFSLIKDMLENNDSEFILNKGDVNEYWVANYQICESVIYKVTWNEEDCEHEWNEATIKECKWVSEDLLVYYMPELRNYARDVFDFYFSTVKTHQL